MDMYKSSWDTHHDFLMQAKKVPKLSTPQSLDFLGHLLDCQVANATGQKVCLLDHLVWKLSAPQRICGGRVIPCMEEKHQVKEKRSRKQMNPFTRLNCRVSSISNCLRSDLVSKLRVFINLNHLRRLV